MIKSISIENFRTHESAYFELSDGVNVLIGESCSGKSNVLRALELLIFNKPSGFKFHSNFADIKSPTIVKIELAEGIIISITKSKNKTEYAIDYQNGKEPEKFSALGQSTVPLEVSELLALKEINFQEQLSPHFVFSPSEMGKLISDMVGNEKPDGMIEYLNKKKNEANGAIASVSKSISENEERIIQIEKHKEIFTISDELENLVLERDETKRIIAISKRYINVIENIKNKTASIQEFSELIEEIKSFESEYEVTKSIVLRCRRFIDSSKKISFLTDTANNFFKIYNEIKEAFNKTKKDSEKQKELSIIIKKIKSGILKIERLELELSDNENLKAKYIEVNKIKFCDKCGQPLKG